MPEKLTDFVKKYRLLLIGVLLLAALCILLTCSAGQRDRYVIDAIYDAARHSLTVTETVHLTNRSGKTLDALCFNLYPNAYASQNTAPVTQNELSFAYPNGFSEGGAQISSVTVAGQDAAWALEGAQKTLLRIQLPFRLRAHGSVEAELQYTVTLPDSRLRMGYSQDDVRLGNVFATLCVQDGEDFRTDGYSAIGDPFLSACADWEVTLTAPQSYVVAGAGLTGTQDGIWRFSLRNARDFALFLSENYHVAQQEHNGITVRSFGFDPESTEEALYCAMQALDVFTELFGEYPYEDFAVCAAQFYVGGMEYPGVTMLDRSLYEADDGMLEFVIAHETAHQWWYAGVGSDQIRSPWQDEALAEYSTLLYYESIYGAQSFDSLYQSMIRPATESAALRGIGVAQELDKFESTAVYDALVYRKGAAMLHDVRANVGNDAFFSALRSYYEDNLYSIAQPEALFAALGSPGAERLTDWLTGAAP